MDNYLVRSGGGWGGPGGWKLRRGCEVSGSGCCVIFSCVSAAQIKELFGVGVCGGGGHCCSLRRHL